MGQSTIFFLFSIMLIAVLYARFHQKQVALNPLTSVTENSFDDSATGSNLIKVQQMNVTTIGGIVAFHRRAQDLTREQKKLVDMINSEQQILNNTKKQIADISQQIKEKSGMDILQIKALGAQLQDDQQLLVAHGQALVALNGQLIKNRQLLAEEMDLVNINSQSNLNSSQDHHTSLNDQSAVLLEKVAQQNNDSLRHAQDLIDEEHQKAQDQQQLSQQRVADQMQRLQDRQNR